MKEQRKRGFALQLQHMSTALLILCAVACACHARYLLQAEPELALLAPEPEPEPNVPLGVGNVNQTQNSTNFWASRKARMLAKLGLPVDYNPNTRYKTPAEILESRSEYVDKPTFADFLLLLHSNTVSKYDTDPYKPVITNIALFKTHKTGSTTLASVLYRFGGRWRRRMFKFSQSTVCSPKVWLNWAVNGTIPKAERLTYSLAFQHLSGRGDKLAADFSKAIEFYNLIINKPRILTMLREPTTHLLSWICFYRLPEDIAGLEGLLASSPNNSQMAEFGISTKAELMAFLGSMDESFELVCITEYFDECLVMMRRRFNWNMLDITYLRLLDSADTQYVRLAVKAVDVAWFFIIIDPCCCSCPCV